MSASRVSSERTTRGGLKTRACDNTLAPALCLLVHFKVPVAILMSRLRVCASEEEEWLYSSEREATIPGKPGFSDDPTKTATIASSPATIFCKTPEPWGPDGITTLKSGNILTTTNKKFHHVRPGNTESRPIAALSPTTGS